MGGGPKPVGRQFNQLQSGNQGSEDPVAKAQTWLRLCQQHCGVQSPEATEANARLTATKAEAVSDVLPRQFVPIHILRGHQPLVFSKDTRSSLWSAYVLELFDGEQMFSPDQQDGRWCAFDVTEAALDVGSAPSRVLAELAAQLEAGEALLLSQLLKVHGVLTSCAHYAVTYSQRLGRSCFIPGFLYDPSWVRQDKVQSTRTLFPHALTMTDVVNDLDPSQHSWGVTNHHGFWKTSWSRDEAREWRRLHSLPADWWNAWHDVAQKHGMQGLLCHNCSYPYIKYGCGLWFHQDDTGEGCERGFCTNLACPESPLSGWWGPAQLIVEFFIRHGIPWSPHDKGVLPLRSYPAPPLRRRSSRRERDRFHPYGAGGDEQADRRVEPAQAASEAALPAPPSRAEAAPEPAPQRAAGIAARFPLLAAAPKSMPPAPPDGTASGAAAAEARPATQGAPAAQAAGSAPAAAPGAVETSGTVHTLETFAASLGSPAESGRPSGHAAGTQLPLLGLESARGALTPDFVEAFEEFCRARQSAAVSSRTDLPAQAVMQAPPPQLPTRLPPVEEAALPPLLAKPGHPSAQACWTAAREGSLHLSDALVGPLEELFNPPGFAAGMPEPS